MLGKGTRTAQPVRGYRRPGGVLPVRALGFFPVLLSGWHGATATAMNGRQWCLVEGFRGYRRLLPSILARAGPNEGE